MLVFGFQIARSAFPYPGAFCLTSQVRLQTFLSVWSGKQSEEDFQLASCLMDALEYLFGLFVCTETDFLLFET